MFSLKSGSFLRTLFYLVAATAMGATAHAQATRFIVTETGGNTRLGTTPIQAGTPISVRITAVDATGATVAGYNQRVTLKFAEPRQPGYFAIQNNTASWATTTAILAGGVIDNVIVTPIHAGSFDRRVTVTDGNIATYDAGQRVGDADGLFSVSPAAFDVTISGSTSPLGIYQFVDDTSQLIRVRAVNADGTTAETYQGTVTLHSNTGLFNDFNVFFFGYTNGVADDETLSFTSAGVGDSIQASDGLVTTLDASGSYTVNTRVFGTNSDRVKISAVTAQNTPSPGLPLSFQFTITNPANGVAPTTANPVGIPTIQFDGPIDFDVDLIDTSGGVVASTVVRFNGNLHATFTNDATATLGGTVVVPATSQPGTFTIRVSAVQTGTGPATVVGKPDLAITRFDYAPGQYRGGEALRFDMTWYNLLVSPSTSLGTNSLVPAMNYYRVEIHLSSNATFGDNDDILVWQGTYSGNGNGSDLLAGQAVSISDSFLLPKNVPGTFYLMAKVNSAGGRDLNFSSGAGFDEVIGPTPGGVLYNGNNVVLPVEDAKITLLPDQGPETNRVSLTSSGNQATAALGLSDNPTMSQNGRFVAFQSRANFDGDGASASNNYNIFLRDALLNSTTLLTPATTGVTNGDCILPHMSSDAHYVVYQSSANNIVNGDTNGYTDIFVRDTIKNLTVRLKPSATVQTNRDSFLPDISGDGRFIVFESNATNIIANSNPFALRQIYLYDRDVSGSGIYDVAGNTAYTLVSKTKKVAGVPGNANSSTPRISRDGNYVVFSTTASNLISASTSFSQIVRWNRSTGALQTVSTNTSNALADGDTGYPVINTDGTYIVYASRAHNLNSDPYVEGIPHLFRAYVPALAVTQVVRINGYVGASATATVDTSTGQLFDINLTNAGSGYATAPSVTITGGGGAGAAATATIDVFTGRVSAITMTNAGAGYTSAPTVTIGSTGLLEPGDSPYLQYLDLGSFEPAISDDGQTVAYAAESINLLPPIPVHHIDRTTYQSAIVQSYEDRDGTSDVYVTDLSNPLSPQTSRASVSSFGYEATTSTTDGLRTVQIGQARSPAMSGDGGYIGFSFDAKGHNGLIFGLTNFDYLATNSAKDIYIYNAKKSFPTTVTDLPAVVLTIPAASSISSNLDLPLSASITLSPRPITKVEFYADGLLVSTATQPTTPGSGEYLGTFAVSTFNVTAQRTFALVAVAVDNLGARSLESNACLVTVNPVVGKLPFVSITNPTVATTVSNVSTLLVQANASDADGTVTTVGFYVDGVLAAAGLADGIFKYKAGIDMRPLTPGGHSLTVQVADNDGNTVISAPVTITVTAATNGAPTVVLTGVPPTVAAGLSIPLKGTATPATGQQINTLVAYANGVAVASRTNSSLPPISGQLDLSFTFTPDTPNTTYSLYVVATDFAGNTVVSATSQMVVGAEAPSGIKDQVNALYQSLFLRSATSQEVIAITKLYGSGATDAQIAANIVQSAEFRDSGGEIILTFQAAWGRYPTYDEYSSLLAQRAMGGTDVDFLNQVFASADYKALYGDLNDLNIRASSQYNLVKKFALRSYANLYGTGAGKVTSNTTTQQIFYNINTLGQDPAQALVTFVNQNLNGGKDGLLLTKLRIAGLILILSNETPTISEVAGLVNVPLINIAEYYSTGVSSKAFKPVFRTSPQATKAMVGSPVTLTIEAVGYPVPVIQWYKNGKPLVGATAATYTIPVATKADTGSYTAKITNSQGTVTSAAAAVQLTGPTVTLSAPASLLLGRSATFGSTATTNTTGSSITQVEFFVNNVSVGVDVTAPFTFVYLPPAKGVYTVTAVATDSDGTLGTSVTRTLTVK